MSEKIDIQKQPDYTELQEQLKRIDWSLDYGSVKIQVREGKATLLVIERTVRLN